MKQFIVLLTSLLCSLSWIAPVIAAEETPLEISGYYKNLHVSTRSTFTEEHIYANTNRLRLDFKKQMDPWQFYLTLDNEAIFNDFENLPDFEAIRSKEQQRVTTWDGDKVSVDDDHLYLRHSIYRAYVKYYKEEFQAVLGKQGVDWGKMRFYSPLDIFNPIGPIDLERENRVGIDAINLNFSPEAFGGINLVVAPDDDEEEISAGLKLYKTVGTYDLSLILASIRQDETAGVSFDGYIKNAGFRGEISYTMQENGREFPRASVGVDYNFTEKIYALVEQFYNGGHDDNNLTAFATSYRFSQQILSLKKNLTSLWLQFKATPLIEINNYLIYDWDGESVVVNPELNYNVASNIDLGAGVQLYDGDTDSEFGSYEQLYYAKFQWFF